MEFHWSYKHRAATTKTINRFWQAYTQTTPKMLWARAHTRGTVVHAICNFRCNRAQHVYIYEKINSMWRSRERQRKNSCIFNGCCALFSAKQLHNILYSAGILLSDHLNSYWFLSLLSFFLLFCFAKFLSQADFVSKPRIGRIINFNNNLEETSEKKRCQRC